MRNGWLRRTKILLSWVCVVIFFILEKLTSIQIISTLKADAMSCVSHAGCRIHWYKAQKVKCRGSSRGGSRVERWTYFVVACLDEFQTDFGSSDVFISPCRGSREVCAQGRGERDMRVKYLTLGMWQPGKSFATEKHPPRLSTSREW